MPTPEQVRASAPRSSKDSGGVALPIVLLIFAFIFGAGALVLTVFGVWPAVILVVACAAVAVVATRKLKAVDSENP